MLECVALVAKRVDDHTAVTKTPRAFDPSVDKDQRPNDAPAGLHPCQMPLVHGELSLPVSEQVGIETAHKPDDTCIRACGGAKPRTLTVNPRLLEVGGDSLNRVARLSRWKPRPGRKVARGRRPMTFEVPLGEFSERFCRSAFLARNPFVE